MTDMTYEEFYQVSVVTFPDDGDIRWGQYYFNLLQRVRPDIANTIRGTKHDPFHRTVVSQETKQLVRELWATLPQDQPVEA